MASTSYAVFKQNRAYLSSDFGENMARRYFGDELIDSLPRYVRGKRKGLIKGSIWWKKVEKGGWVKTGRYNFEDMEATGYVESRVGNVIKVELCRPAKGYDCWDLVATWLWDVRDFRNRDAAKVTEAA